MNIVRVRSDGTVEIEIPFNNIQEMFAGIGPIQEVFALAKTCGKCGSENTRLGHKVSQAGKSRFEARCLDCDADLRFIERTDGSGVFPDTQDRDKNLHPNKGWSIFVPERQGGYQQGGVSRPPVQQHEPAGSNANDDLNEDDIPF